MNYKAKILLFGEYTVIQGTPALAAPFGGFSGRWQYGDSEDPGLRRFADYLSSHPDLRDLLDITAFETFLREGGFFDSDIPMGYGAGSSGALVAAVYDRFAHAPVRPESGEQLRKVRSILAAMESFFHGSSSGADPLVSYAARPLLFRGQTVDFARLPENGPGGATFFLLDTGIPRQTGPLVTRYLNSCKDEAYLAAIQARLMPPVESAIESLLAGGEGLFDAFRAVSRAQWQLMPEMIPENCRALWAESLRSQDWSVKFCGAGGGGFLLGLIRNGVPEDLDAGPLGIIPIALNEAM